MIKLILPKEEFLKKINYALHFTSTKISNINYIQGIFLKGEKNIIHIYSTNLSYYFHTTVKTEKTEDFSLIIEPRKVIDFLNLLPPGKITLEINDKKINIKQGNINGEFPLIEGKDFPIPPKIEEKKQRINTDFLLKNLPLVLFSTSNDESRPVLTGVNFLVEEDNILMVSTDGFRLSLLRLKKEIDIPSLIIPVSFLNEVLNFIKKEKEIDFFYSSEEKMIKIKTDDLEFFSRLIEGDFPPFEKVIPNQTTTSVELDKEEFLRNVKLVAIFSRDYSNIIILKIKKNGLFFQPKIDKQEKDITNQEIKMKGEEIRIAFNYKFLLDLLKISTNSTAGSCTAGEGSAIISLITTSL